VEFVYKQSLKKLKHMKKLLLVLAIAGFAVDCNNDSEKKTEEKTDSTSMSTDTTSKMSPDTTHMSTDTTAKKDTTKM
jgi:hypothetical protein